MAHSLQYRDHVSYTTLTIEINFNSCPSQIEWKLLDSKRILVEKGQGREEDAGSEVIDQVSIIVGELYFFSISDTSNGKPCGQTYYTLSIGSNPVLFTTGLVEREVEDPIGAFYARTNQPTPSTNFPTPSMSHISSSTSSPIPSSSTHSFVILTIVIQLGQNPVKTKWKVEDSKENLIALGQLEIIPYSQRVYEVLVMKGERYTFHIEEKKNCGIRYPGYYQLHSGRLGESGKLLFESSENDIGCKHTFSAAGAIRSASSTSPGPSKQVSPPTEQISSPPSTDFLNAPSQQGRGNPKSSVPTISPSNQKTRSPAMPLASADRCIFDCDQIHFEHAGNQKIIKTQEPEILSNARTGGTKEYTLYPEFYLNDGNTYSYDTRNGPLFVLGRTNMYDRCTDACFNTQEIVGPKTENDPNIWSGSQNMFILLIIIGVLCSVLLVFLTVIAFKRIHQLHREENNRSRVGSSSRANNLSSHDTSPVNSIPTTRRKAYILSILLNKKVTTEEETAGISMKETAILDGFTEQDISVDNRNNIITTSIRPFISRLRLSIDGNDNFSQSRYSPKTCPICLENYAEGEDICWSNNNQCIHVFHVTCMADWLMTHDDCPLCRADYLLCGNCKDNIPVNFTGNL